MVKGAKANGFWAVPGASVALGTWWLLLLLLLLLLLRSFWQGREHRALSNVALTRAGKCFIGLVQQEDDTLAGKIQPQSRGEGFPTHRGSPPVYVVGTFCP